MVDAKVNADLRDGLCLVQSIELIDARENQEYVSGMINKNGFDKEHSIGGFFSYIDKDEKPYFACFDKEYGYGILFYMSEGNEWTIYSQILAPEGLRLKYFEDFLNYAFINGARKVWIETDESFRKHILKILREGKKYRSSKIRYKLWTPIFNLKSWDGDKMEGKDWKDIRYYWNRFFKEHKVEFKDAKDVDKDSMKDLVRQWNKERTSGDRADCNHYNLIIDSGFEGYTHNRIMIVDGKTAAITAGFKIPNSNGYYSAVGIYAREFDRIGEVSNMDDLMFLKKQGYDYADFGNGEKKLTDFKRKFKPERVYVTYIFSIVPIMK